MDWQTLRNQFMRTIGGDPPGAALEDKLITLYTEHPEALERAITKIELAFKAGKIHSPWGALSVEADKAVDAARNPTHDKGSSRTKAVARAEQRIRNELLHYDREDEITDELFGPRGTLKDHDTPATRQRILDLWHQLRPLGEQVEADANARGKLHQQQRHLLRPTPGNVRTEAELKAIAAAKAADTTNLMASTPAPHLAAAPDPT